MAVQLVASPHNMTQGSSRLLPWQLPVNIRGRPVESAAVSRCSLLDKLIGRSCGQEKKKAGRREGKELVEVRHLSEPLVGKTTSSTLRDAARICQRLIQALIGPL